MKLIKAFVDHKRTTLTFLVIVLLYGYFAYNNIPKESDPDVKIPIIYVSVLLEGISPEDSQRMLIKPLENSLRSIIGIKQMTSYAAEGSASIVLEFFAGFNSEKALQDVRNKVNDAQNKLPKDVKTPLIKEVSTSLFPVLNIMLLGDVPERTLIKIAKDLKDKIEGIPEVLEVQVGGDRDNLIEIRVEPKAIEHYGLSLQYISSIIASNNSLVTAGIIKNLGGEFGIKIPSLIKDYEELLNFPIKANNDKVIKVKDIAEILSTYKDPNSITRVNGQPAIVLEVSKRTGANIIFTIEKVKELLTKEMGGWPPQLKVLFAQDKSDSVKDMLLDLENSLLLAGILVVIVIILSVGLKASVLISLSLPISFLGGILILYLSNYSLNIVVLFSLILTVGMIVDDAIVVSEYADRKMIEGYSPTESYITAASRMFLPIVSATLVKMIVFMPLLFWPGVLGQFMKFMPITVIIIMANSLIFALFFQPSLASVLIKKHSQVSKEELKSLLAAEEGDIKDLQGLSKIYYSLLIRVLNAPRKFVATIITTMVAVYLFFFTFGTGIEFFPSIEPESAALVVRSPGNLSVWQKNQLMQEVESKILDMSNEVKSFYTKSGDLGTSRDKYPADSIGVIQLEFANWQLRRKANVILDEISARLSDIKGIEFQTVAERKGPNEGKPIEINISAKDYDKIAPFIAKLRSVMESLGGFKDTEDSRPVPGIEWHIEVDRELAARYGVTVFDVGTMIRLATNGFKISSYYSDYSDEEIDIVVRFPEKFRLISELEKIKLVTANGSSVPISAFAKKVYSPRVTEIKLIDQKPVITIKSDVNPGVLVDTKVREIKNWLENNIEEGIEVNFKGEEADKLETSDFLTKAFLLALSMMFIVMLLQFNSFYHTIVIMSAIFLSMVGVLIGLIASWQPFGIVMCGIGVIALSGIVLNNNILFIDTYQHLRKNGHEVKDAIIRAGIQRVRPILLTALTAILGLLPMVVGITINFFDREVIYNAPASQWWKQLSASIAGGLTFATILTLFFTPCLLLLGKRFDRKY